MPICITNFAILSLDLDPNGSKKAYEDEKKTPIFYSSRIVIAVIILLIYIFGLRPLRRTITQQIVYPTITAHVSNHTIPYQITNKGTAVIFQRKGSTRVLRYQPQLGFFFLIALLALVFITKRAKWYLTLIGFHIVLMFLMFGILYLGISGWNAGLSIVDFFVRYLIPGLTFGYAAYVYHKESRSLTDIFNLDKATPQEVES